MLARPAAESLRLLARRDACSALAAVTALRLRPWLQRITASAFSAGPLAPPWPGVPAAPVSATPASAAASGAAHCAKGAGKRKTRHVFDRGSTGVDTFRSAVAAAFRLIDASNDGKLQRDEVLKAVRKYDLVQELLQLPADVSEADLQAMLRELDPDSTGCITEAQWNSYFCPSLDQLAVRVPPRYDPKTAGVTGFLIDLDGTIYRPGSLIQGARTFYRWLRETGTPHVFLSNTGAKGPEGTQRKLGHAPYQIADTPVPLDHIFTAADAQANYMVDTLPPGSRVLVVSGGGQFWRTLLTRRDGKLVRRWHVATRLTDERAKEWAVEAALAKEAAAVEGPSSRRPRVVVAFFLDGQVSQGAMRTAQQQADDGPGRRGGVSHAEDTHSHVAHALDAGAGDPADGWNYELIKHCAFLLRHGADLIYTADDPFNPSLDAHYSGTVFPLPGPGMFASMLRPVLPLGNQDQFLCCGKGGNVGRTYMMEHAIEMLRLQGHDGNRDAIMLVGDRFGTDVRGAVHVGIKSCLVESGCEQAIDQGHYPTEHASYCAPSVDFVHPWGPGLEADADGVGRDAAEYKSVHAHHPYDPHTHGHGHRHEMPPSVANAHAHAHRLPEPAFGGH